MSNTSSQGIQPTQRHPRYYFKDGNLVIELSSSNVLYNLNRSYLELDSGLFQTMLSLRPEDRLEGQSDTSPVVIPNISARDFDWFLDYQLRHILPKDDEEALTAILNLGHFFLYDAAQTDAQAALEGLPSFGPVARYSLGLRNGIKDWVVSGFTVLVSLPFSRLSLSEVQRMGEDATFTVNDTRFQIDAHRGAIAYHVPPIREAPSCTFHFQCEVGWDREWKVKVARHLMHPEGATSGREILAMLDRVEVNDVHPACKDITIQTLRDNKVLTHEEEIVESVLRTIVPSN
ncbi:hypothetical protein LXA43DRAFT_1096703 [Ganoderma leucocontextum]|nr:hypothetical protein LXA43DRAFT_1096703 [Ganoderma leucocontextum]